MCIQFTQTDGAPKLRVPACSHLAKLKIKEQFVLLPTGTSSAVSVNASGSTQTHKLQNSCQLDSWHVLPRLVMLNALTTLTLLIYNPKSALLTDWPKAVCLNEACPGVWTWKAGNNFLTFNNTVTFISACFWLFTI